MGRTTDDELRRIFRDFVYNARVGDPTRESLYVEAAVLEPAAGAADAVMRIIYFTFGIKASDQIRIVDSTSYDALHEALEKCTEKLKIMGQSNPITVYLLAIKLKDNLEAEGYFDSRLHWKYLEPRVALAELFNMRFYNTPTGAGDLSKQVADPLAALLFEFAGQTKDPVTGFWRVVERGKEYAKEYAQKKTGFDVTGRNGIYQKMITLIKTNKKLLDSSDVNSAKSLGYFFCCEWIEDATVPLSDKVLNRIRSICYDVTSVEKPRHSVYLEVLAELGVMAEPWVSAKTPAGKADGFLRYLGLDTTTVSGTTKKNVYREPQAMIQFAVRFFEVRDQFALIDLLDHHRNPSRFPLQPATTTTTTTPTQQSAVDYWEQLYAKFKQQSNSPKDFLETLNLRGEWKPTLMMMYLISKGIRMILETDILNATADLLASTLRAEGGKSDLADLAWGSRTSPIEVFDEEEDTRTPIDVQSDRENLAEQIRRNERYEAEFIRIAKAAYADQRDTMKGSEWLAENPGMWNVEDMIQFLIDWGRLEMSDVNNMDRIRRRLARFMAEYHDYLEDSSRQNPLRSLEFDPSSQKKEEEPPTTPLINEPLAHFATLFNANMTQVVLKKHVRDFYAKNRLTQDDARRLAQLLWAKKPRVAARKISGMFTRDVLVQLAEDMGVSNPSSMDNAKEIENAMRKLENIPKIKSQLPQTIEAHHPFNAQIHNTLQPLAGAYPAYYNVLHTKQDMSKDAPYAGDLLDTYRKYCAFAGLPQVPATKPIAEHLLVPAAPIECGQCSSKDKKKKNKVNSAIGESIPARPPTKLIGESIPARPPTKLIQCSKRDDDDVDTQMTRIECAPPRRDQVRSSSKSKSSKMNAPIAKKLPEFGDIFK